MTALTRENTAPEVYRQDGNRGAAPVHLRSLPPNLAGRCGICAAVEVSRGGARRHGGFHANPGKKSTLIRVRATPISLSTRRICDTIAQGPET
jgi:hypothetical protein